MTESKTQTNATTVSDSAATAAHALHEFFQAVRPLPERERDAAYAHLLKGLGREDAHTLRHAMYSTPAELAERCEEQTDQPRRGEVVMFGSKMAPDADGKPKLVEVPALVVISVPGGPLAVRVIGLDDAPLCHNVRRADHERVPQLGRWRRGE